jgi:hypothetical protein
MNFNIDLLAGSRVECRRPGTGNSHQMVVTFPTTVTVGGVTVSSKDNQATATRTVNGAVVTVDLANVSNDQTLEVTLTNVSDSMSTGDVPIQLPVLLGDTTGDRFVNSGDVTQTKNRSGQTVTTTNFRSDVTTDGTINSGDALVVRGRSGTALDD